MRKITKTVIAKCIENGNVTLLGYNNNDIVNVVSLDFIQTMIEKGWTVINQTGEDIFLTTIDTKQSDDKTETDININTFRINEGESIVYYDSCRTKTYKSNKWAIKEFHKMQYVAHKHMRYNNSPLDTPKEYEWS